MRYVVQFQQSIRIQTLSLLLVFPFAKQSSHTFMIHVRSITTNHLPCSICLDEPIHNQVEWEIFYASRFHEVKKRFQAS